MSDESDTTETTEEVTKTTVAAQPGEDYEKRFKGLQKLFDKNQKRLEALEAERDTLLESRESLTQTEKQRLAELDKAKVDLDLAIKEKETLTAKLSTHEANAQRTKIILSEFSDLSAFEAQGLLPAASTEEEMRTKFTAFRTALGTTIDKNVQQKIQGAGPAPTGAGNPPVGRSKETIYAELQRLAGSRSPEDRAKYDALVEEWDKLTT